MFTAGNRPRIMNSNTVLTGEEYSEARAWDLGPQDEDCPFCGAHEIRISESRPDGFPDHVYYQRIHQEDCVYIRFLNQAEERILA